MISPPALSLATNVPRWRALWTRAHAEQLVFDQLAGKGFRPFLPRMKTWSKRAGQPHRISVPMFPGYLFLHDALDKHAYVEVIKTRGLVAVLSTGDDRLAAIPDEEIAAVERIERIELPMRPYPFVREGARVHLRTGPLAGLEGVVVRFETHDLVVVSVELLGRSIAVEVDRGVLE